MSPSNVWWFYNTARHRHLPLIESNFEHVFFDRCRRHHRNWLRQHQLLHMCVRACVLPQFTSHLIGSLLPRYTWAHRPTLEQRSRMSLKLAFATLIRNERGNSTLQKIVQEIQKYVSVSFITTYRRSYYHMIANTLAPTHSFSQVFLPLWHSILAIFGVLKFEIRDDSLLQIIWNALCHPVYESCKYITW